MMPRHGVAQTRAAVAGNRERRGAHGNWTVAEAGYRAVLARVRERSRAEQPGEALRQLGCPRAALAALEQGTARLVDDDPLRRAIEGTATAAAAAAGAIPADPAH